MSCGILYNVAVDIQEFSIHEDPKRNYTVLEVKPSSSFTLGLSTFVFIRSTKSMSGLVAALILSIADSKNLKRFRTRYT